VKQNTLNCSISFEGKGVHTGKIAKMEIHPAPVDTGYTFQRVDLPEKPSCKANVKYVENTTRGTSLKKGTCVVKTVEHLLAALRGCDIDNVLIQLNNEEVPILDGSSHYFVESILEAGIKEQEKEKNVYKLQDPIFFISSNGKVRYEALPEDSFSIETLIEYDLDHFPSQRVVMNSLSDFIDHFASARTFAFLSEIRPLLEKNLIRGGDLQNALVFVDTKLNEEDYTFLRQVFNQYDIDILSNGILNNVKLRFEDEPVRHKTLDILGDLALVGVPFTAKIFAKRPGHANNIQLAKLIQKQIENTYGIEIA